ncbi:hypothetical protein NFI96_023085 [Prochilodus magdalenae]|nr:hypothetical protein NFI96_023085 [Prochilodus magdalenae]
MMGPATAAGVLLMLGSALGGEHSLYYTYTALSKDLTLTGIYKFSALGLLDDQMIDYYNSKDQMKVPRQDWMKEKLQPNYWEKGTQSRKSKEQWFKVNLDLLMERMRHNKTDLHVLQWRHGCEIDDSNGQVTLLRGVDEYGYDGEDFISFNDKNMQWIAPVPSAEPTKRKWDTVASLNQYTKGYLEKECVDWLREFLVDKKEEMRKYNKPDIHVFVRKSETDSDKLTLTCLATGFYPRDVVVSLRKFNTSLPEHLLTTSGVRPNDNGTYQLRKRVEIQEDHPADYHCYVTHSSLQEPVIKQWDRATCNDCSNAMTGSGVIIGGAITGVVLLAVVIGVLKKKGIIGGGGNGNRDSRSSTPQPPAAAPLMAPLQTTVLVKHEDGSDTDSGRGSSGSLIGSCKSFDAGSS